jgi:hypothetical protein
MLPSLWLILLFLRTMPGVPDTHRNPAAAVSVEEPVIIILK